jgi:hypothetical protein
MFEELRSERDEYKQAADALARALNILTIENDRLRRDFGGHVVPPAPLNLVP